MKKLTLLLVMLLAFGLTLGFADEDQVTFELDGSASTTFGLNLDKNANDSTASGLQNATEFGIDITLVSEQSAEKGEGDVYGWIEFEDFALVIEDGAFDYTAGDVNAELHIGSIYIDIDGSEAIEVDEASIEHVLGTAVIIDEDDADPYEDSWVNWEWDGQDFDFPVSGVLVVGYKMEDLLDVYAKIGSFNDWFEDPAAVADQEHTYALGFGAEVTPMDGLTVNADVILGMNYATDQPMAFSVGAEYEMALNDTMDLVPFVGVDAITKQGVDEELWMEIGGGVKLLWPGFDDEDSNEFSQWADDDDIHSGVSLSANYVTFKPGDAEMNLVVALYEDSGDESLVPGLGAQAYFEWIDVTNAFDAFEADDTLMGFGAYVDYAIGDIMPYAKVTYDNFDSDVTLTAGVELSMIPNTTFTLQYYNPRVIDMNDTVTLDAGYSVVPVTNPVSSWAAGDEAAYKGNVTFEVEIAW